jgi:hypothetical protein
MTLAKKIPYTDLANSNPYLWKNDDGSAATDTWQLAVLLAIRDELKSLNALLHCSNFTAIPDILRSVKRNTTKRRKPRAVGKPKLRVVSR